MKKITWIFPIVIIVIGFILWRVYLQMPHPQTPQVVAAPSAEQLAIDQLTSRVDQLQAQLHHATEVYTLPEIKYYLNLAHVQLSILYDVKTSLNIMRFVQTRLKTANAPSVLQEALAADIADLELAPTPHLEYINQKIMEVQQQVMTLPLRSRQEIKPPVESTVNTESTWRKMLSNTWGELKSLIRVQPRNTSVDYVLFDETILRETVKVELQRTSIGAVLGQTDLYQASLQQAILALEQFFKQDDPNVQQALNTLENLTGQAVVTDIPKADRAFTWLQAQEQSGAL
jgi:uncharacterized protein HemX